HRGRRRDRHRLPPARRSTRAVGPRHRPGCGPCRRDQHVPALHPGPGGPRGLRPRTVDRQRDRAGPWRRGPTRRLRTRSDVPHLPAPARIDHVNRILIVEDEERISSFLAKGLKAEGFTTTVVADGVSGLDYALT